MSDTAGTATGGGGAAVTGTDAATANSSVFSDGIAAQHAQRLAMRTRSVMARCRALSRRSRGHAPPPLLGPVYELAGDASEGGTADGTRQRQASTISGGNASSAGGSRTTCRSR